MMWPWSRTRSAWRIVLREVSDHETGAARQQHGQRALQTLLGLRVNGTGHFVEEEQLRFGEQGARDSQYSFVASPPSSNCWNRFDRDEFRVCISFDRTLRMGVDASVTIDWLILSRSFGTDQSARDWLWKPTQAVEPRFGMQGLSRRRVETCCFGVEWSGFRAGSLGWARDRGGGGWRGLGFRLGLR